MQATMNARQRTAQATARPEATPTLLPPRIAVLPEAALTPPPLLVGEVTFYGPPRDGHASLMVRVWNWRVYHSYVPECPECVDAIALLDPEHIGKKVWLKHPDGEVVGPLMVVDCAETKHRPNLRKRGWVADISWELAQRWQLNGPLEGVTVLFEQPGRVDVTMAITQPSSCPAKGCAE
jgi:hypothetical protein